MLPVSCPEPPGASEVVRVKEPFKIHENIFSCGELKSIEQSLMVKTQKGLAVIVGCSHPGVKNILKAASQLRIWILSVPLIVLSLSQK